VNEIELDKPIVSWLQDQHWDVYQEVQFSYGGGVADIVAVRNGIMWFIESKTSYSFRVLEQAAGWPVHFRSIAIPSSKVPRDYRVAVDYYKVGVIEVRYGDVYEAKKAPLFIRSNKRMEHYYRSKLTELHKTFALAGSPSGCHLTPYKATMIEVRAVITKYPGCTIGFLYDQLGDMHYSSRSSFKGNLLKALDDFEEWCNIDKSEKPYKLSILNEVMK
jgi:hypothetical protein